MQPYVQKMILLLKKWSSACNLHLLSSYALTMMTIFYLQVSNYLPSVETLKRINNFKCNIIDGEFYL